MVLNVSLSTHFWILILQSSMTYPIKPNYKPYHKPYHKPNHKPNYKPNYKPYHKPNLATLHCISK